MFLGMSGRFHSFLVQEVQTQLRPAPQAPLRLVLIESLMDNNLSLITRDLLMQTLILCLGSSFLRHHN